MLHSAARAALEEDSFLPFSRAAMYTTLDHSQKRVFKIFEFLICVSGQCILLALMCRRGQCTF